MSHKIRAVTEFDNPGRFREWILANAGGDGTVELLDSDGNVVDCAVVDDGTISFERETVGGGR